MSLLIVKFVLKKSQLGKNLFYLFKQRLKRNLNFFLITKVDHSERLEKQLLSNQMLAFFHRLIARIYFILLKNVLKQTWNSFNTKLRPLRKDWNSTYQVIQVLAIFLSLIAVWRNRLKKMLPFYFLMFYQKKIDQTSKKSQDILKIFVCKISFWYLCLYREVNLLKTVIFRLEFT